MSYIGLSTYGGGIHDVAVLNIPIIARRRENNCKVDMELIFGVALSSLYII
jgi:hypothetical protein